MDFEGSLVVLGAVLVSVRVLVVGEWSASSGWPCS